MKTPKNAGLRAIKKTAALFSALLIFAFLLSPALVSARVCDVDCSSADGTPTTTTTPTDPNCNNSSDAGVQKCIKNNQIVKDLNKIVAFLSAGVGIVVTGAIIVGGIQYTLAGDNSTATQAAKKRITDGLIALVAFIFTFAFLQWLIPGGL